MSRRKTKSAMRAIVAVAALGVLLAACSDPGLYLDRRETVALGAEDAVAANMAEQTVDPWPPHSANNNLTFNGERMQRAVECYRANKSTQPADLNPSSSTDSAAAPASGACQGQMAHGSAQPAIGAAIGGGSANTAAK